MNKDAEQKSSVSPQSGESDDAIARGNSKGRGCSEGQACGCRVLVDLMAMRAVIPLYVIYAIYLYWTLPTSSYLSKGY